MTGDRDVRRSNYESSPGLKRKLGDVDFLSFVNKYDVILLSETCISNSENLNLDIEGYSCEQIFENTCKSRGTKKGRFSGGIYYQFTIQIVTRIKFIS